MAKITKLEKELSHQQDEVAEEKSYLEKLLQSNTVTLLAILLPAFTTGWGIARLASRKHIIRRLVSLGLLSSLNQIRKHHLK